MTKLDIILKRRDISLPIKIHIFKAMVYPVVIFGWESWTIKKAECQKVMLSNGGAGEHFFESPLDSKEIKPINPKGNPP